MKSSYRFANGMLVDHTGDDAQVVLYVQPTDEEKQDLLRVTAQEHDELEPIFDSDEVPRLERLDGGQLLIWKAPDNVTRGNTLAFEVYSMGFFITAERVIVIIPGSDIPVRGKDFKDMISLKDFILRVLLSTIHHYLGHLKAIKLISQEVQAKIVTSMENRYLLQMFTLSESLVYYHNALESNLSLLSKLRTNPERLGLTHEDIAFLDDLIIENHQASKQAKIYSVVLSGLMDVRASIINNNMNIMLKKLTIINVVFMPLNLIAGIGGMSEFSRMTAGLPLFVSYSLFVAAMVGIGFATWWWLAKVVDRIQNKPTRRKPRKAK